MPKINIDLQKDKYMVIEHWTGDIAYCETLDEAQEQANYWQKEMEEYADSQGEFPHYDFFRIEIVKIIEVRDVWKAEGEEYYKYKTEMVLDSKEKKINALKEKNQELYKALAFARSVIKSGEEWTGTCEKLIDSCFDKRMVMPND